MKKLLKKLAAFIVFVMLMVVFAVNAAADFGNFSGDSDYGSDSSYDYDYDYDSDYDGEYGGIFDYEFVDLPIVLFIFAIMMIYIYTKDKRDAKRKGRNQNGKQGGNSGAQPATGLQSLDIIKQSDPLFSEYELKERLAKLYVQMQNCWSNKDITSLRGDFTDSQFARYDRQLQQYRDNHQTSFIERIAVLDVNIRGVKPDNRQDILIVNLSTRIVQYTLDDRTGRVVSGDKTREKFMQYEWTLVRPKGTQTIAQNKDFALNCPNCGAPLNINKSAQCPYCGSIVSTVAHDWVIAEIKGLSQRTV